MECLAVWSLHMHIYNLRLSASWLTWWAKNYNRHWKQCWEIMQQDILSGIYCRQQVPAAVILLSHLRYHMLPRMHWSAGPGKMPRSQSVWYHAVKQECVRLHNALVCIEMQLGGYKYIIRSAQYQLLVMLFPVNMRHTLYLGLGFRLTTSCSQRSYAGQPSTSRVCTSHWGCPTYMQGAWGVLKALCATNLKGVMSEPCL